MLSCPVCKTAMNKAGSSPDGRAIFKCPMCGWFGTDEDQTKDLKKKRS